MEHLSWSRDPETSNFFLAQPTAQGQDSHRPLTPSEPGGSLNCTSLGDLEVQRREQRAAALPCVTSRGRYLPESGSGSPSVLRSFRAQAARVRTVPSLHRMGRGVTCSSRWAQMPWFLPTGSLLGHPDHLPRLLPETHTGGREQGSGLAGSSTLSVK